MKLRFMLHFLLKTNMSMYIVFRRKRSIKRGREREGGREREREREREGINQITK